MTDGEFQVVKATGERAKFSLTKLRGSLKRSGADEKLIDQIVNQVRDELYQGISTREIYDRAFTLLKKKKSVFASKYRLKNAIYELGPTGFPFEKFVAAILKYSGYAVEVGKIVQGNCVTHEVDILARKNGLLALIECKFHGDEGRNCNVKVPLYIHSRYNDIKSQRESKKGNTLVLDRGWVVTNTRFTQDAIAYGKCADLHLLSWDMPKGDGLKDRIDRLGLYPITVSTLLTDREKQFLLGRDVVLCRQLLNDDFFLDHLEVGEPRKEKIIKELRQICNC